MRTINYFLAASAMLVGTCLSMPAAEFKVIANPSVEASAVSLDDLKSVFLETKMDVGGGHVMPVLEKAGAAHEAFVKECLGKSDAALSTYYRSLVFTGKGAMPKAFASDADVVEYVAKTKGAIGYVGPGAPALGVKTLEVK